MISDSICCRNVISLQITNLTPGNHQPSSFKNEGSTSGVPSVPCHSVSIQLQELEQLVRLLSISGLFFCRECVVGHQQRVCPTSCTNTGRPPELTDTAIKTNQKTILLLVTDVRSHLWPAAPASSSVPRCCDSFLPVARPSTENRSHRGKLSALRTSDFCSRALTVLPGGLWREPCV